jgi:hypothetical protein
MSEVNFGIKEADNKKGRKEDWREEMRRELKERKNLKEEKSEQMGQK